MSESAYVKVQPIASGVICAVLSEKVGGRESQVIEQEIRAAMTAGAKKHRVIMDMKAVGMLASMGLGMLVSLHKSCAGEGGKLVICNLSEDIAQVLKITHLEKVLRIVKTQDDAIKALG